MGQVHPMPSQSDGGRAQTAADAAEISAADQPAAEVRSIGSAHCALCGGKLSARSLRYHVVSPQFCETITVCHTCHKAALGEGYRPAE
jgi:hypothetical protein